MASSKINSALVLMIISSMTAVSVWKAMPDKIKQESTIEGGKQNVTDVGEGEEDVPKPTTTASTEGSLSDNIGFSYRLLQTVTPMTYRLRMIPIFDEKEPTFTGDVTIVVRAELSIDAIIMHSEKLIISAYKVVRNDGSSNANLIKTIQFDKHQDIFIMKLRKRLAKGDMYTISLKFKGTITNYAWYDGFGLSKISYKDKDGSTHWMAASYFMPTSARKAFPCFDEPHFKANFTISIARKEDMTSLSNMDLSGPPERDSNLPETYVWDHYRESPKMPTYLVAFIVSKFKSKKAEGKEITAWAREDFIDDLDRALSDGRKILDAMENFTQTKLDLPKMDLIAVPDLSFPGIGSVGLVQCREMDVIYRKGVSSASDLQDVTVYTAHDISHQWFGYLVTPEWWGYRWLNEGFAAYLSYTATDMIEPSWRIMEQFTVVIQQPTFYDDSYDMNELSPPIEKHYMTQYHNHPFTYNKGSSLLRMMEHFLTRNTFREGLRVYLSTRCHNTSNDNEFFDIMDTQAKVDGVLQENLNVRDIMESWTRKAGFPILTVERNYKDGRITLTQTWNKINRRSLQEVELRHCRNPRKNWYHNTSNDNEFFDIMDAQGKADGVLQENLNVRDIMESWTRKAGFPILTVERNYKDGSTTLTQEKCVSNRTKDSKEGTWWIPITFTTKELPDFGNTSPLQWMSTNHTTTTLDKNIPSDSWVIFNLQQTGFYRVNYDERNWKLITEYLNSEDYYKVHPINRAQLIDDAFNLARYEYLDYRLALDLGTYLARETDYIPWYTAFETLEYLDIHLAATEVFPKFKSYVLHLINAYYEAVKLDESPEDDHLKRLSRSKVTLWACRYGHDGCQTTATKLFKQWMDNKINTIPVDSRKAVYCTAISVGDEQEWNFLWDEFLSSTIWNEQELILEALGCSRNQATLKRYLARATDTNLTLTSEEREAIFTAVINTLDGRDAILDFPLAKLIWGRQEYIFDIHKFANRVSTKVQMEKIIKEMKIALDITSGDLDILEINVVMSNNAWREKNIPVIESWLKTNVKTNKS